MSHPAIKASARPESLDRLEASKVSEEPDPELPLASDSEAELEPEPEPEPEPESEPPVFVPESEVNVSLVELLRSTVQEHLDHPECRTLLGTAFEASLEKLMAPHRPAPPTISLDLSFSVSQLRRTEEELDYGLCPRKECAEALGKSLQCPRCHQLAQVEDLNYQSLRYSVAKTGKCSCEHCEFVRLTLVYGDEENNAWGPEDSGFQEIFAENPFQEEAEISLDRQYAERVANNILLEAGDDVIPHPIPPTELAKLSSSRTRQTEETRCLVCQEEFQPEEEVIYLSCTHEYHTSCIRTWFSYQNWCPKCHQEPLIPTADSTPPHLSQHLSPRPSLS